MFSYPRVDKTKKDTFGGFYSEPACKEQVYINKIF